MKWVIGGLLLGVGGAVYSGRVPVEWVVYSFAVMFGCWGLALFLVTALFRGSMDQLVLRCAVCVTMPPWSSFEL